MSLRSLVRGTSHCLTASRTLGLILHMTQLLSTLRLSILYNLVLMSTVPSRHAEKKTKEAGFNMTSPRECVKLYSLVSDIKFAHVRSLQRMERLQTQVISN